MSSIVSSVTGGLLGGSTNSGTGGAGLGFAAQPANIVDPIGKDQLGQEAGLTHDAFAQQQGFLRGISSTNGLGNQQSVYNQLQGVANGTGPNPAQAQLANATGANVSNQAALMAGQRGSAANIGMIGRQAAMQGANTQQQAAGQAAALQAQQSLGALGQMGGMATNQVNQQQNATNAYTNAALQNQQNIYGATGAQNNAHVGMQSNINSSNAPLAGVAAGQQGNMMNSMMGAIGSVGQMIPGAMSSMGGMFGGGSSGGLGSIGGSTASTAGGAGDAMGGLGDMGEMLAANGGMVPQRFDSGGFIDSAVKTVKDAFTEDPKPKPSPTPVNFATPQQANDMKKVFGDTTGKANGGMIQNYDMGGSVTPLAQSQGATSGPQSNVGKSFMDSQDQLGAYDQSQEQAKMPARGGLGGAAAAASSAPSGGGMPDFGKMLSNLGTGISKAWQPIADNLYDAAGSTADAAGPAIGSTMQGAGSVVAGAGEAEGVAAPYEADAVMAAAKGGRVPALVSKGEQYLNPKEAKDVVSKGKNPLKTGERIPGKPQYPGNDYRNDVVPKKLEAGGIVIPNEIMQSKDAAKKAAAFVAAHLKSQSLKRGK